MHDWWAFLFVPECPRARDGVQLFSCPTPDRYGIYRCIDDHALCDNKPDCPNREDENKTVCMFHKMVSFGHLFCYGSCLVCLCIFVYVKNNFKDKGKKLKWWESINGLIQCWDGEDIRTISGYQQRLFLVIFINCNLIISPFICITT